MSRPVPTVESQQRVRCGRQLRRHPMAQRPRSDPPPDRQLGRRPSRSPRIGVRPPPRRAVHTASPGGSPPRRRAAHLLACPAADRRPDRREPAPSPGTRPMLARIRVLHSVDRSVRSDAVPYQVARPIQDRVPPHRRRRTTSTRVEPLAPLGRHAGIDREGPRRPRALPGRAPDRPATEAHPAASLEPAADRTDVESMRPPGAAPVLPDASLRRAPRTPAGSR
jgi:hypothetical protein